MTHADLVFAGWSLAEGRAAELAVDLGAVAASVDAFRASVAEVRDASAETFKKRAGVNRQHMPVPSRDPMKPEVGLWAAVIFDDDPEEARRALQPLLDHRRAQGIALPAERGKLGVPGLLAIHRPRGENPKYWVDALRDAAPRPPYYLLLVGGPDRIPFEVQLHLDQDFATGRLDVGDTPSGPLSWAACAAYAEKVVRYEQGLMPVAPQALLYSFATDRATRRSHPELSVPLCDHLASAQLDKPIAPPLVLFGADATSDRLAAELTSTRPGLVVTVSHGIECFRDAASPGARALWGALTDSTFASGGRRAFSAEMVPRGAPFAPGAVVLSFACFSAGVPGRSKHRALLEGIEDPIAGAPFTAALPRALLASPEGPVAFVGHVDRATSGSFRPGVVRAEPAAFIDFADWWLGNGGTLGRAVSTFREQAGSAAVELGRVLAEAGATPDAQTSGAVLDAWLRYHDTLGYVLLGDPVLRLAAGGGDATAAPRGAPAASPAAPLTAPRAPDGIQGVNERAADPGPLYFNGIDGSTGDYLAAPVPADLLADRVFGDRIRPHGTTASRTIADLDAIVFDQRLDPKAMDKLRKLFMRVSGAGPVDFQIEAGRDTKKLDESGWGVVFAARNAKDNAAIRDALGPLLEHRKAQCSDQAPYREFIGDDAYGDGQSADQFLGRFKTGLGSVDPEKVPYYLLLVGDPEAIPYRVQYELDVQYAVGRIHFDTLDEYASYARSVVEAEKGAVKLPRRATFFGTRNEGDPPTQLSLANLVKPLAGWMTDWPKKATQADPRPSWEVTSVLESEAVKQRLRGLLGGAETPALLFTASHGMGFPRTDSRILPHTGALLCQDWPGRNGWFGRIPQDFYLAADDIGGDARLHGLIAFFFACYGAGIPLRDPYASALWDPSAGPVRELSPYPFVAQLPRRLLGHPKGGALAVVGHIEKAMIWSFMLDKRGIDDKPLMAADPNLAPQVTDFQSMLHLLLQGYPIGAAMDFFNVRYAEMSTKLTGELEEVADGAPANKTRLAQLWTLNNEARNYVLLGDPAVRLAVASGDEPTKDRGTLELVHHDDRVLAKQSDPRQPPASPSTPAPTTPAPAASGTQAGTSMTVPEVPSAGIETTRAAIEARLLALVNETEGLHVTTFVGAAGEALVTEVQKDRKVVTRAHDAGEPAFAQHAKMVEAALAHRRAMIETLAAALARFGE